LFFIARESPAEHRLHSDRQEKVACHGDGADPFEIAALIEVQL